MNRTRAAVVGVGHLGKHHARILNSLPDVDLVAVCDSRLENCKEIASLYNTEAVTDFRRLVGRVDAVVVAVPTVAHREVASVFLSNGISSLVEKPLAPNSIDAEYLVRLAKKNNCILQVGHIERFNPGIQSLPVVERRPRCIQATRVGKYTFRSTDISVVFDLMIHDLDLVSDMLQEDPIRVDASAWSLFGGHEDVAMAELIYPGTLVQLTASRADCEAKREMTIWWDDHLYRLDLAAKHAQIVRPLDAYHEARNTFTTGVPVLDQNLWGKYFEVTTNDWSDGPDQLTQELISFVTSVKSGTPVAVTGSEGLKAVRLAEMVHSAATQESTGRRAA